MVLSHGVNPDFFTVILCCPADTPMVDGVLPTKLPSISMSAPSGVDDTCRWAWSPEAEALLAGAAAGGLPPDSGAGALLLGAGVGALPEAAAGVVGGSDTAWNLARSSFMSPFT